MKKLTLGRRISIGFAALSLISVALGLVALKTFSVVYTDADDLANCPVSIVQIHKIIRENYALVHEHVRATDKAAINAKIALNRDAIGVFIENYDASVSDPATRKIFDQFKIDRAHFVKEFTSVLELSNAGKTAEAKELSADRMESRFIEINTELDALSQLNQVRLNDGVDDIIAGVERGKK